MDEPEEYIDFMAKYRDWISIKKLGIRSDTKPEEVAHYLAGVRSTANEKAYSFLQIDTKALDSKAKEICSGMRKSYSSLTAALHMMESADTKRAVSESCSKELAPIAEAYLIGKIVSGVGYESGISQEAMAKAFPGLKMPKTPGFGRKRKG